MDSYQKERLERRGEEFKQDAKQKGQEIKEDFKGAARRVEGEVTGNKSLQREHEPSMLEKTGEALSNAGEYIKDSACATGEYIKDTACAAGQKLGLTSEGKKC